MKALGASEERKKIKERSMRGRRAKAAAGKWVGQGAEPFGYNRAGIGRETRLTIRDDEAATVRRIFALFNGATGNKPLGIRPMTELFTAESVPTPSRGGHIHKHGGKAWHQRSIHMILTRRLSAGVMEYR